MTYVFKTRYARLIRVQHLLKIKWITEKASGCGENQFRRRQVFQSAFLKRTGQQEWAISFLEEMSVIFIFFLFCFVVAPRTSLAGLPSRVTALP